MAHNEDDGPPQVVHHLKVPRRTHPPGEIVLLDNGGRVEQVPTTWSYLWSEMPDMRFSDSFLNEWGVCIASNRCPSRENAGAVTDGGIGRHLRRFVAQRAKSAREGVRIAGELIERFGYDATGRTYTICDPDEGWIFCAIQGKRWLAQRVPDDAVAFVANTYTPRQVDLGDTAACLGSDDLVDYATSQGWYDPERDGPFDFARAYADPLAAADSANVCRQWGGLRLVAADVPPPGPDLPFSVRPAEPLDVRAAWRILRDHYEGTELHDPDPDTGSPHDGAPHTICNSITQTSFVAELRRHAPGEIGSVYWMCLGQPCGSIYVPIPFGIATFPAGYRGSEPRPTPALAARRIADARGGAAGSAFWRFTSFAATLEEDWAERHPTVRAPFDEVERQALELLPALETRARTLHANDPARVPALLSGFARHRYLTALAAVARVTASR
jgi:dipeptidase